MTMGSRDKQQTSKNHHLIQAMGHAIDGIIEVLKEERNMRYHVLAAILAILVAFSCTFLQWNGYGSYWPFLLCLRQNFLTQLLRRSQT